MAEPITILVMAFAFSFTGSIPPGSINLSVMQLGLDGKQSAALRFALAAALVEYPYAYLALRFENLMGADQLISRFSLLGAVVMIALGLISWWSHRKPIRRPAGRFSESGFRKGVIISLLNPLAIPFWIGVVAFLKSQDWIALSGELEYHFFAAGVSLGTFFLLVLVALLSRQLGARFADNRYLRFLPAAAFLSLGLWALIKLILS